MDSNKLNELEGKKKKETTTNNLLEKGLTGLNGKPTTF